MQNEIYCHECHELARAGDLEGLLRAREAGCHWDKAVGFLRHRNICMIPAAKGDLVTLQWLREQGCPEPYWRDVIGRATESGCAEVVSWACAQGLPMNEWVPWVATWHNRLEILQCLVAAGCPWNPGKCLLVANGFHHAATAAWIEWWMSPAEVKEPGEA